MCLSFGYKPKFPALCLKTKREHGSIFHCLTPITLSRKTFSFKHNPYMFPFRTTCNAIPKCLKENCDLQINGNAVQVKCFESKISEVLVV